jgi:general nucleoside transport system permease protein
MVAGTILTGLLGGAIRGSIPYMYVSLGECLTEKSGRINLGMEGILLMGAMTAFGISDKTGSPWTGVLAAACVGAVLGLLHAVITELPGVNDVAAGIAMIVFGSGVAFYFGKQFVAPMAPQLSVLEFGSWTSNLALRSALRISPLFFLGIVAALVLTYALKHTRWGLHLRAVGDAPQAARAMGISTRRHRMIATIIGASLAAVGGAHLTLYFPGIWSEGISGGQGLMAVALVIFARWNPIRCLIASLFFGGAQALGPALQSAGFNGFYHVFNASPYLLTLVLMIMSCSPDRTLVGMPGTLGSGAHD